MLLLFYPESTGLLIGTVLMLVLLSTLCALWIVKKRSVLREFVGELREDESTPLFSADLITFVAVTLFLSLTQL